MGVCVKFMNLNLPIGHREEMCSKQLAPKIYSQERWLHFRCKFDHPIFSTF